MGTTPLVLGSGSPRRRDLLESLGLRFQVRVAGVEETPFPAEAAAAHVVRLAAAKSEAVAALLRAEGRTALVLAADTTVAIDGALLGKPGDADEALAMLERLAGRRHEVWTACRLVRTDDGRAAARAVRSVVTFAPWDPALARWYVASGEPMDKAGAYAVQGKGALLVAGIEGSWSNVVGLPLEALPALFAEAGDDLARRLVEASPPGC